MRGKTERLRATEFVAEGASGFQEVLLLGLHGIDNFQTDFMIGYR